MLIRSENYGQLLPGRSHCISGRFSPEGIHGERNAPYYLTWDNYQFDFAPGRYTLAVEFQQSRPNALDLATHSSDTEPTPASELLTAADIWEGEIRSQVLSFVLPAR